MREIGKALGIGKSTAERWLAEPPPEDQSPVPNHAAAGNGRAVTHGAFSAVKVEPRAQVLTSELLTAHPHLDRAKDGPAVKRYAVTLARLEHVYAWLEAQADPVFADQESGDVHAIYGRLAVFERQAAEAERELALSPLTRVKLGLDLARGASLSEQLASGREALERRGDTAEAGR